MRKIFKLLLVLLSTLAACNTLLAQNETIKLKWIGKSYNSIQFLTTSGTVTVDWGDGRTITRGSNGVNYIYLSDRYSVQDVVYEVVINSPSGGKITNLVISGNNLVELDVRNAPSLEYLSVTNSKLAELDVSGNTILRTLNCSNNQLINLDLSANVLLTNVYCNNNNLTAVKLPALVSPNIYFEKNHLSFDSIKYIYSSVSNTNNLYPGEQIIPSVKHEVIKGNGINFSPYFFSTGTNVISVTIDGNAATLGTDYTENNGMVNFLSSGTYKISINNSSISDKASLVAEVVVDPKVQRIQAVWQVDVNDLTKNINLMGVGGLDVYIDWGDGTTNQYTERPENNLFIEKKYEKGGSYNVTIVSIKGITFVDLSSQKIKTIDVSACSLITELYLGDNDLRKIDVANRKMLRALDFYGNNLLEQINASGCESLEYLNLSQMSKLYSINLKDCKSISSISLYELSLSELELSGCVSLMGLNLYNTGLKQLNVTSEVSLQNLSIYGEPNLTAINAVNNTLLSDLGVYESPKVGTVNLSGCSSLKVINIQNTSLNNLNLNDCNSIEYFSINNSNLQSLDLSEQTNLQSIFLDQGWIDSLVMPQSINVNELNISNNFLYKLPFLYTLKNFSSNINYGTQQYPKPISISTGASVDYSDQLDINGVLTSFTVIKGDDIAVENTDYTITNGVITFLSEGLFTVQLTNSEVEDAIVNSIVSINGKPQKTEFTWQADASSLSKTMYLQISLGAFTIDWGDGEVQNFKSASGINNSFKKIYNSPGEYKVTINASEGSQILHIQITSQQLLNIDLSELVALQGLSVPYNRLSSIDVSNCTNLNNLDISYNFISSLTLGNVSKGLQYFALSNNYLSDANYLYDLYESLTNVWSKEAGLQMYKDIISIQAGETVDYSNQLYVNSQESVFTITDMKGDVIDPLYYSINSGVITIYSNGVYLVNITNDNLPSCSIQSTVVVGVAPTTQNFSFSWSVEADDMYTSKYHKNFAMQASQGSILVDWGDGSVNQYNSQNNQWHYMNKEYDLPGIYNVNVYADSRVYFSVIDLNNHKVTALDVSGCWALIDLYADMNRLTEIKLDKCISLKNLYANHNKIKNLDLSGCQNLLSLSLYENKLDSLDLSVCSKINNVNVANNNLRKFAVSSGIDASIYAQRNRLPLTEMYKLSRAVNNPSSLYLQWQVIQDEAFINAGESRSYADIAPVLNGKNSEIEVFKNDVTAEPGTDYTLTGSDIVYHNKGDYTIEVRNPEIVAGDDAYGVTTTIVGGEITLNKINLTWNVLSPTSKYFSIHSSKGVLFNIDWGNDNTTSGFSDGLSSGSWYQNTYNAIGSYNVKAETRGWLKNFESQYNDITEIDLDAPEITHLNLVGNNLKNIDISKIKSLEVLYIQENMLFFEDMISISDSITNANDKHIGTQYIESKEVIKLGVGKGYDYSKYFNYNKGNVTYKIYNSKEVEAVQGVDYSLNAGVVTYLKQGRYRIEFTNDLIVSSTSYPAKIASIVDVIASSDGTLKQLDVNSNPITLTAGQYNYVVFVNNSVTTAEFTALINDPEAVILTQLKPITLVDGYNLYEIVTKAQNGDLYKYTINIVRQSAVPENDATLLVLGVDIKDIGFSPSQYTYDIEVEYESNFAFITAWLNGKKAIVSGGNIEEGSNLYSLQVGENTYTITITAEDGITVKTYEIKIRRKEQDVTLKKLTVNGTNLPIVDSQFGYGIAFCANITSAIIDAEPTNPNALVSGLGCQPLQSGDNEFTITVTSRDGTLSQDYLLTILRYPEINAGNIGGNLNICSDETGFTLSSTVRATGGAGTLRYQWERSTDALLWENIPAAENESYTENNFLTNNTYYRRRAYDDQCQAYSNTVTVFVTISSTPIILGPTYLCEIGTQETYSTETGMLNYNWTVVGGNIVSGQNTNSITVNWISETNSSVAVNYTNGSCQSTANYDVRFSNPNPVITGYTTVCKANEAVKYSTNVGMSNYNWQASGGTIVSGQNTNKVEIVWNSNGLHSVSVNYDNGSCPVLGTRQVSVGTEEASIVGSNLICNADTVSIYLTQSNMQNYVWQINGGNIISGQGTSSISVQWLVSGEQSLAVEYFNGRCTLTADYDVNVSIAKPSINGPATICENQPVIYTTDVGFTEYIWQINGGIITEGGQTNEVTVLWDKQGANSISVQYNKGACTALSNYKVNVNFPSITIKGPDEVCADAASNIYYTDEGMQKYKWTVIGGTISGSDTTNVVNIIWTSVGINTVELNYTTASCSYTTSYTVEVNSIMPTINGPTILCDSYSATYTTESGMSGYSWVVVGGTIISGQGSSSIQIGWTPLAKTKSVGVAYEKGACKSFTNLYVYINISQPQILGPNTACINSIASVYQTNENKVGYNWSLSGGGRIVAGQGTNAICVIWDTPGSHNVVLAVSDPTNCVANIPALYTVDVGTEVVPVITGPSEYLCIGSTQTFQTDAGLALYKWTVTGGTINGADNTNTLSVTWNTAGSHTVNLSAENATGCKYNINKQVSLSPAFELAINGPEKVCADNTNATYEVVPTGNSIPSGLLYNWVISNGSIISGNGTDMVNVSWSGNGSISVGTSTSDGCTINSQPLAVSLSSPVVPIITGPNSICLENANAVYLTGAGMATYNWSVTGGTIIGASNKSDISVVWNTPGIQTVSLTVTNIYGCASYSNYKVLVNDPATVHNTNLQSITVNGIQLPDFAPDKFNYTLTVPCNVSNVSIIGVPQSTCSQCNSFTDSPLNLTGYSKFDLTVVSQNGDISIYTVNVSKPMFTNFESSTLVYNGMPQGITANIIPDSLQQYIKYRYTGISGTQYLGTETPPIDAGKYKVRAYLNSQCFVPDSTVILTIAPKSVTVTPIDNQSKVYGQPDSVLTYSVSPDLIGSDSINGTLSRTAGEDVGSYAIQQGSLANPNYSIIFIVGKTFTILKATPTVTLTSQTGIYTGDPLLISSPQVNGIIGGAPLTFIYEYEKGGNISTYAVDAGTYNVKVTLVGDGNHNNVTSTATFTVEKAQPWIRLTSKSINYTGNPIAIDDPVIGGSKTANQLSYLISYKGINNTVYGPTSQAPSDKGEYQVTVNTVGDQNHLTASQTVTLTIGQSIAMLTITDGNFTYDGTAKTLTANVIPNFLAITYLYEGVDGTNYPLSDNAPINAGNYKVIATTPGDNNFAGISKSGNLTINKTASSITADNKSVRYTGDPVEVNILSVNPVGATLIILYEGTGSTIYPSTANAPINSGTYKATVTFAGDVNYLPSSVTVNLTITSGSAPNLSLSDKTVIYNGSPQNIDSVVISPPAAQSLPVTYTYQSVSYRSNEGPIDAGEYMVTATTPQTPNFDAGWVAAKLTILKADQFITFNEAQLQDKVEGDMPFTIAATSNSGLDVSFISGNTDIVEINGKILTIKKAGIVTITAIQAGNNNYNSAIPVTLSMNIISSSATVDVTINGNVVDIDKVYDLECSNIDNLDVKLVIDDKSTINIDKEFTVDVSKPIYKEIAFVVSPQAGEPVEYILKIRKNFTFDDIVLQKWNNLLMLDLAKLKDKYNYVVDSVAWYKDGKLLTKGTKPFYSAGNNLGDHLTEGAEYKVEIKTSGVWLKSCPKSIQWDDFNIVAYPNPVKNGGALNIRIDVDEALLKDAVIDIYDMQGRKVGTTVNVTGILTTVNMPTLSGIYILNLKGNDGLRETFKIIVE